MGLEPRASVFRATLLLTELLRWLGQIIHTNQGRVAKAPQPKHHNLINKLSMYVGCIFITDPYFWPGTGSDQTSSNGGKGSGTRHTLSSPQHHHFTTSRPGPNEQRFGVMPTHHHHDVPAGAYT